MSESDRRDAKKRTVGSFFSSARGSGSGWSFFRSLFSAPHTQPRSLVVYPFFLYVTKQ